MLSTGDAQWGEVTFAYGTTQHWSAGAHGPNASVGGVYYIYYYPTTVYRLVVSPSGKVGIGTGVPTEALEVIGNIRASGDVIAYGSLVSNGGVAAAQAYYAP